MKVKQSQYWFVKQIACFLLGGHAFCFSALASGFGILKEEIRRGEFIPRTCVASLLAEKQTNDWLLESTIQIFVDRGLERDIAEKLIVFKAEGPKGIEECLRGPFEDVTILAHGSPAGDDMIFLTYEEIEEDKIVYRKVLPTIFRNFEKPQDLETGVLRLGPNLRQLTIIGCGAATYVKHAHVLANLSKQYGIKINLQPSDWLFSKAMGREDLVTNPLMPWMIAESAQPEYFENIFCVYAQNEVLFADTPERTTCLRNYYEVHENGVSLGLASQRRILEFKQKFKTERYSDLSNEQSEVSFARAIGLLSIELGTGRSLNLNLHGDSVFKAQSNYGVRASLFENFILVPTFEALPKYKNLNTQTTLNEQKFIDELAKKFSDKKLSGILEPFEKQHLLQLLLVDRLQDIQFQALKIILMAYHKADIFPDLQLAWISQIKHEAWLPYQKLAFKELEFLVALSLLEDFEQSSAAEAVVDGVSAHTLWSVFSNTQSEQLKKLVETRMFRLLNKMNPLTVQDPESVKSIFEWHFESAEVIDIASYLRFAQLFANPAITKNGARYDFLEKVEIPESLSAQHIQEILDLFLNPETSILAEFLASKVLPRMETEFLRFFENQLKKDPGSLVLYSLCPTLNHLPPTTGNILKLKEFRKVVVGRDLKGALIHVVENLERSQSSHNSLKY